ncbi:hypothetical protein BB561_002812 [Smittium simulii]|uniref:Aminotransferase class V domain-containing protein n=1 Tax=Smittium simulii TaxID=133385 RepID=A0A2T9YP00_9FUNG|nr:hypothetical protein BB561_002812 [Smittium simulii]
MNNEDICPSKYDNSLAAIAKPALPAFPEFGKQMRAFFSLDPNYLILNNGSFGSIPKYVSDSFYYYHLCSEFNPDRWMNYVVKELFMNTLKRFSPYIGCKDYTQLTFTQNTTTSINSALRSFQFNSGDIIVRYNTTYGGCYNSISFVCDRSEATAIDINLSFPCSSEDIIDSTLKTIEQVQAMPGKKIRLAVVDAISALPGIVFPYQKLVTIFKNLGAKVFVDAAHALGQIDLDIDSLGCDYLSTNAHKWFFTKRGCAIFYVAKELHSEVHPTTISWAYNPDLGWNQAFFSQGVTDYSAYLTLNPAMDFIEAVGGLKKIQDYNHKLALDGMELLKSKYNLEPLTTDISQIGTMFNIKLPLKSGNQNHDLIGANLSKTLLMKNASGATYKHNGNWLMRLTASIFSDATDFDHFGKLLIETINEEKNKLLH